MSKVKISAIRAFDTPPGDCNYVMFLQEEPYLSEEDALLHLKKTVLYSKHFGVYTVPFRFLKDNYLTMCMISPSGDIIGAQSSIHLNMNYRGTLMRSSELTTITTEDATFFLCVDVDIFSPEVMRSAALSGAQIILCNRFMDNINSTAYRVCRGAENCAVSNKVYVIDLTEEGGHFISPFSEQACIRTKDTQGVLNTVWECDVSLIDKLRKERPIIGDKELYKKYIDFLVR